MYHARTTFSDSSLAPEVSLLILERSCEMNCVVLIISLNVLEHKCRKIAWRKSSEIDRLWAYHWLNSFSILYSLPSFYLLNDLLFIKQQFIKFYKSQITVPTITLLKHRVQSLPLCNISVDESMRKEIISHEAIGKQI